MGDGALQIGHSFPAQTSLRVPGIREAVEVWEQMFAHATESIDIEQLYIASKSESRFDRILERIRSLAKEGLRVRVLLDERLFERNLVRHESDYVRPVRELESVPGLQVCFAPFGRLSGGVQHAKYFVVDSRMAWIGSQNFDWRSLEHIFEVGVRVEDERLVADLMRVFEMDWGFSGGEENPKRSPGVCPESGWCQVRYSGQEHVARIVGSPQSRLPSRGFYELPHIIDSISNARKGVAMQLRDFTTMPRSGGREWRIVHSALRDAADRGVQVRLMFDAGIRADFRQLEIVKDLACHRNIDIRLLSVPDSSDGPIPFARMLHAKTLVVDMITSWIGSSNCSPDDFLRSRNVGIIVRGPGFAQDVQRIFDTCWHSCYSSYCG